MLLHIVQLVHYCLIWNTEHVEKDGSDAARGTKGNPRRRVVKKHVTHVEEVHMTQPILFLQRRKLVELGGAHLYELRKGSSLGQRVRRQL